MYLAFAVLIESRFLSPDRLSFDSTLTRLHQVRLAALRAAVAYLTASDTAQHAQLLGLLYPMLNTLPTLPHALLPPFLAALTDLAVSAPLLFRPHIPALLAFLPALLLPAPDAGPTPTVTRPNPGGFTFPPPEERREGKGEKGAEEDEVRKAALEFMTALSEARPGMVRGVHEWMNVLVRGALEGMGEIPEDDVEEWLDADVSSSSLPLLSPFLSLGELTAIAAGGRPDGRGVPTRVRTRARPRRMRAWRPGRPPARVPVHPGHAREPRLEAPACGTHGCRGHRGGH